MTPRTIAIGDIHGDADALRTLLGRLPALGEGDHLVFLGDYVNRGPASAAVVGLLRDLQQRSVARVTCLRGNHEDAWLRVRREGWDEFVYPPSHGCLATFRSFAGLPPPGPKERPTDQEMEQIAAGSFFPEDVVGWMESLPFWAEDSHAIYVHAGLPKGPKGFLHPSEVAVPPMLAWVRTEDFTRHYRGKCVVFGHTPVRLLPPELSTYTPEDPNDLWKGENTIGLDTGCGRGGFLTAIELPTQKVIESR